MQTQRQRDGSGHMSRQPARNQWLTGRLFRGCLFRGRRTVLRLTALSLMLAACAWLAGGCGLAAGSAGVGGGVPLKVELPAGWHVFEPEREFSSVAATGDVVIAGGVDGAYVYGGGNAAWRTIEPEGGAFRLVKALLADDRGNLWIGHAAGLSCLPGFLADTEKLLAGSDGSLQVPCRTLEKAGGRQVGAVACLLAAQDGLLYAGSQSGALVLSAEEAVRLTGGEGADAGVVGTEGGVGDMDVGRWLTPEDGFTLSMVNAMLQDRRGTLWFGSYIARGGGLVCMGPGFSQFFDHDSGLADDYVTTIAEDADGAVWVGSGVYTSGGAARFIWRDGAYHADGLLGLDDGLAGAKVRHIHVDAAGNLWFCSEYDGIAVMSPQGRRIRLLTTADGLPDNEVKQVAADAEGGLWFACRRGMLHLDAAAITRITAASPDTD